MGGHRAPVSATAGASVAGLVLVVALAVGSSAAGESAHLRTAAEVDRNFRGTYDVLVRPPAGVLEIERTGNLVEANFLGLGGTGGISIERWRRIQALPGVEVAAPIAAVGYLEGHTGVPTVRVPAPSEATVYRIQVDAEVSDGVRPVRVFRESGLGYVRAPPGGGPADVQTTLLGLTVDQMPGGFVEFDASRFPVFPWLVVGVDAREESRLLDRVAFAPMAGLPRVTVPDTDDFPVELIPERFAIHGAYIGARRAADAQLGREGAPVVPLLLNDSAAPAVRLSWRVWRSPPRRPVAPGEAAAADPEAFFHEVYDQERAMLVVDRTLEVQHFGLPLVASDLVLTPGPRPQRGGGVTAGDSLSPRLPGRPAYAVAAPGPEGDDTPAFRVRPLGFARTAQPTDPLAYRSYDGSGLPSFLLEPALEQAYRPLAEFPSPALRAPPGPEGPFDRPYFLAPLGTLSLVDLAPPFNPLNYAPLGAYDPADTILVEGAGGSPARLVAMRPTFNAAGFIVTPPAAFTTIAAAALLKGDRPIDAVRVRVQGITGFDPQSQERLIQVARAIEGLGLRADVVAGSSPRDVFVYVPAYLGDPEAPVDLGWVRQRWTSLGAAARVTEGLTELTSQMLLLALAAALFFAFTTQGLAIRIQAREIAVLRAIGWRREQVRRRLVWSAARVALVATVAGLAGGAALVAALDLAGWLFWAPAAVAAAWMSATPMALRRAARITPLTGAAAGDVTRTGRVTVSSPFWFAWRQVSARPGRSIHQVVGLGLGCAAAGMASLLMLDARRRAGPTLLAGAVAGVVRPLHVLLALAAAALLLVGVVASRSVDRAGGAAERRALSAIGWRPRAVTRVDRGQALLVGMLATPFGAVALLGGTAALGIGRPAGVGAAAAVVAASCCMVSLAVEQAVAGRRPGAGSRGR